jgi:nucleoid-associated protein EbfC
MTDPEDAPDTPDPDGASGLGDLGDLFSGGMPDVGSLMEGLEAVQNIQAATYVGTAGGGLVRIKANGRMDVESVEISPDALADGADVDELADLVHAALRDLTAQIAAAQQQAMGPLGGILGG